MPFALLKLANFDSYYSVVGDESGMWIGRRTENRDLPIRQISPNHWNIRCLDATANMYLFMAATLSADMTGMKQKLPLDICDFLVLSSEHTIKETEERLSQYGITEPIAVKT